MTACGRLYAFGILTESCHRQKENNQTPINNEGVCHGIHSNPRTLEQRQAGRPKATAEAEGHLGNPNSPSERAPGSATSPCSTWRSTASCAAAISSICACATSPTATRSWLVQWSCSRKTQRPVQFELTEPTRAAVAAWIEKAKLKPDQCLFPSRLSKIASCFDAAIRPDRPSVGCRHRTRSDRLRHAHDAPDQGHADLQANEEPEGRSATAWPYQARKHGSIPRHRGR